MPFRSDVLYVYFVILFHNILIGALFATPPPSLRLRVVAFPLPLPAPLVAGGGAGGPEAPGGPPAVSLVEKHKYSEREKSV